MMLMAEILVGAAVVELLAVSFFWRGAKLLLPLTTLVSISAAGALFIYEPNGLSGAIVAISMYRGWNALRVIKGRLHPKFLQQMAASASSWLISATIVIAGLLYGSNVLDVSSAALWISFAVFSLITSVLFLLLVIKNIYKTRMKEFSGMLLDKDIPSITVAIPARNETNELETVIQSVIANAYPKLEIIVLDDCSQDKRTPEIIRSFAHQGVRFLAGEPPQDGWLAKNQAYQQLLEAASGEYIIFMGVDIELKPNSLRQIVATAIDKQKTMVSLLPLRSSHANGHYSLTQPMRYIWELLPLRRLFNRPPVLSSCWIISRSKLLKYGGFKAVKNTITPEAYLARKAIQDNDGYSFMRSNFEMGILSSKSSSAQRQTAIRTRYPQLHKRIELVALFMIIEAAVLLAPFAAAILGFFVVLPSGAHLLAIISSIIILAIHGVVAFATKVNPVGFSFIAMPLIVLNDLWLLHYSMYKYELSSVSWKERDVCIPVMQVIPRLPKLD